MASQITIVLVHGAWADGSSWGKVIPFLQDAGHTVIAVQLPLTSLAEDVATTRRALGTLTGPVVLAGHSYGGAVITKAGSGAENVTGVVYIASFPTEEGESVGDIQARFPARSAGDGLQMDADGFTTMDPAKYHQNLMADATPAEARVMAAVQHPAHGRCFGDAVSGVPAWKQKPSWYQVSTDDAAVHPDAQRFLARRCGATMIELDASHIPMVAHPRETADLILAAARAA